VFEIRAKWIDEVKKEIGHATTCCNHVLVINKHMLFVRDAC
jgi:hypothetical protein